MKQEDSLKRKLLPKKYNTFYLPSSPIKESNCSHKLLSIHYLECKAQKATKVIALALSNTSLSCATLSAAFTNDKASSTISTDLMLKIRDNKRNILKYTFLARRLARFSSGVSRALINSFCFLSQNSKYNKSKHNSYLELVCV